jgi:hypothetical protein
MSEKELKPILVLYTEPGREGGQPGVIFTNDLSRIPEGCLVFCNGKVYIDRRVTLAMLNKKTVHNIHLKDVIAALNARM